MNYTFQSIENITSTIRATFTIKALKYYVRMQKLNTSAVKSFYENLFRDTFMRLHLQRT